MTRLIDRAGQESYRFLFRLVLKAKTLRTYILLTIIGWPWLTKSEVSYTYLGSRIPACLAAKRSSEFNFNNFCSTLSF